MEQAGDGITVAVPGIRDLIAELKALNENVARRTVRKVIREAGEYILRRLKANAPVFTGKLRFNLDVVTKWKSRSGIMVAKVRVSTQGKAENPRNAFYWRFVEFGHRIGSVDPETGEEYWSVPYQATSGSVIMSPVRSGNYLYVGGYSSKSMVVELADDQPAAEMLWRDKAQHGISPIAGTFVPSVRLSGRLSSSATSRRWPTARARWRTSANGRSTCSCATCVCRTLRGSRSSPKRAPCTRATASQSSTRLT